MEEHGAVVPATPVPVAVAMLTNMFICRSTNGKPVWVTPTKNGLATRVSNHPFELPLGFQKKGGKIHLSRIGMLVVAALNRANPIAVPQLAILMKQALMLSREDQIWFLNFKRMTVGSPLEREDIDRILYEPKSFLNYQTDLKEQHLKLIAEFVVPSVSVTHAVGILQDVAMKTHDIALTKPFFNQLREPAKALLSNLGLAADSWPLAPLVPSRSTSDWHKKYDALVAYLDTLTPRQKGARTEKSLHLVGPQLVFLKKASAEHPWKSHEAVAILAEVGLAPDLVRTATTDDGLGQQLAISAVFNADILEISPRDRMQIAGRVMERIPLFFDTLCNELARTSMILDGDLKLDGFGVFWSSDGGRPVVLDIESNNIKQVNWPRTTIEALANHSKVALMSQVKIGARAPIAQEGFDKLTWANWLRRFSDALLVELKLTKGNK